MRLIIATMLVLPLALAGCVDEQEVVGNDLGDDPPEATADNLELLLAPDAVYRESFALDPDAEAAVFEAVVENIDDELALVNITLAGPANDTQTEILEIPPGGEERVRMVVDDSRFERQEGFEIDAIPALLAVGMTVHTTASIELVGEFRPVDEVQDDTGADEPG